MVSTSETGHAKNVANFQHLTAFISGYGTTYNPTKSSLKLTILNSVYMTAQGNLADVITKNTAFNNIVNERVAAFGGLRALGTRLINALEATDAPSEKIKDAQRFNRKLHGKRIGQSIQSAVDTTTPIPKTISVSQLSYDQLIQHFAGLLAILKSEPSYAPNEPELKLTTLFAKLDDLNIKNNNVAIAYAAISNSRISRDKTLYDINTGLVEIAREVKKYIKSVYGATSPEYDQVKGIQFRKVAK